MEGRSEQLKKFHDDLKNLCKRTSELQRQMKGEGHEKINKNGSKRRNLSKWRRC